MTRSFRIPHGSLPPEAVRTFETLPELQRKSRAPGGQRQGWQRTQSSVHGAGRISFSSGSQSPDFMVWQEKPTTQCQLVRKYTCRKLPVRWDHQRKNAHMCKATSQSKSKIMRHNWRTRGSSRRKPIWSPFGRTALGRKIGRCTFETKRKQQTHQLRKVFKPLQTTTVLVCVCEGRLKWLLWRRRLWDQCGTFFDHASTWKIQPFFESSISIWFALKEEEKLIMKQFKQCRFVSTYHNHRGVNEKQHKNYKFLSVDHGVELRRGRSCRKERHTKLWTCLQKRVGIKAGGNAMHGCSSLFSQGDFNGYARIGTNGAQIALTWLHLAKRPELLWTCHDWSPSRTKLVPKYWQDWRVTSRSRNITHNKIVLFWDMNEDSKHGLDQDASFAG